MEENAQQTPEQEQTELPLSGTCMHQPDTMADYIKRAAAMLIKQAPRDELGPLPTFAIPTKARNGPPTVGATTTEHGNTYASLAP